MDARSAQGNHTALIEAAGWSAADDVCTEIAKLLLDCGADVNARGNDGGTALISAGRRRKNDLVRLLLKHGADVHSRDNLGHTALLKSAAEGRAELIGVLCDHGAEVNAKDHSGWSPLMLSAREGHVEVIRMCCWTEARRSMGGMVTDGPL